MGLKRWQPSMDTTRAEQFLLKRLTRTRKLFGFLRLHRHELFDDEFQAELESMYRETGAGREAVPPALLAMVVLLQAYHGISDAEAVELSVVDLRWQLVLGVLGTIEPAFSQGTLAAFRARLIQHDMDRRLLERTVELARRTKEFDWKKLPKDLRVAVDSMPLEGGGRVEDTINLLAHAARKVIECVAMLLDQTPAFVALSARAPLLGSIDDAVLTAEIKEVFHDQGRYGAPRIRRALRRRGVRPSKKRVARLMRALGLRGYTPRRFRKTTDSRHTKRIAPNLLACDVSVPNLVLAGDITYIATTDGWLYLAVLLDLHSRRVVGWAMSDCIDTELALSALRMAASTRPLAPNWIHHTDRDCRYGSDDYLAALERLGARPSMSRKGDC